MNKKQGFTLAETLIVIGVIGVVAIIVIPLLTRANDDKEIITALKKNYSNLQNVYAQVVQKEGTPDTWGIATQTDEASSNEFYSHFKPYLKTQKECGINQGCFPPNVRYRYRSGSNNEIINNTSVRKAKVILVDGTLMNFELQSNTCTLNMGPGKFANSVCGSITVDVNGFKGPNQFGHDYFIFFVTKYGILPRGGPNSWTSGTFANSCRSATGDGYGCAAWVVFNGNRDYLYCDAVQCPKLDWNLAHSIADIPE